MKQFPGQGIHCETPPDPDPPEDGLIHKIQNGLEQLFSPAKPETPAGCPAPSPNGKKALDEKIGSIESVDGLGDEMAKRDGQSGPGKGDCP